MKRKLVIFFGFAKERNLEVIQDEALNVIIKRSDCWL